MAVVIFFSPAVATRERRLSASPVLRAVCGLQHCVDNAVEGRVANAAFRGISAVQKPLWSVRTVPLASSAVLSAPRARRSSKDAAPVNRYAHTNDNVDC